MAQRLRLHTFKAKGVGSIPGQRTKILQMMQQEKNKQQTKKPIKTFVIGNSLAVQRLGRHDFTAKVAASVPGWGAKILQTVEHSHKQTNTTCH